MTLQMASVSESITVTADAPIVDTTSATDRSGAHARTDRVAADRPFVPVVPAARSGRSSGLRDRGRQPGLALGRELQRHRRQHRSVDRQLLLRGRHQRHRSADRYLRCEPQHRDHSGAEGHDGRHPGRIRRRPGPALQRRHQVGQQQLLRLGQLLHAERLAGRRQQGRATGADVLDVRLGRHPRRSDRARQGVVLRQLPHPQHRNDVVTNQGTFLRTVTNEGTQAYGKLSWQLTSKDRVSGTFTNDPTDISGSTHQHHAQHPQLGQKQGGDRYSLEYNRVFSSNFLLDAAVGKHNGEVSTVAAHSGNPEHRRLPRAPTTVRSPSSSSAAPAPTTSASATPTSSAVRSKASSTPASAATPSSSAWSRKITSTSATAASSVARSTTRSVRSTPARA